MSIKPASSTTLGGVKIGNGIDVTNDGTISVNSYVHTIVDSDFEETEDVEKKVLNEELISMLNDIVENPDSYTQYFFKIQVGTVNLLVNPTMVLVLESNEAKVGAIMIHIKVDNLIEDIVYTFINMLGEWLVSIQN